MKDLIRENKKILVFSIAAIALFMLFLVFIHLPKHRSVQGMKTRIKHIETQTEKTHAMLGDLNKLGEVLASMQTELAAFESRIPAKENISSVLSELSNIAKTCSVDVLSIKPEKPKPFLDDNAQVVKLDKRHLESIKVELMVRAHYKAVAEYIKNIQESLNILATIDRVVIVRDELIFPKIDAELVFTVYVVGED